MSTIIRIMTHNVWNRDENTPQWEGKGKDCSAKARLGGLLRVWEETAPDLIGCQEVSAHMADLLMSELEKKGAPYTLIWGRYTPILYRSDRFELVASEFGTYPETIEGLEGTFNDLRSKSCSLAVLRHKESGRVFLFATTHLWWKKSPPDPSVTGKGYQEYSDEAREYQMEQLLRRIDRLRRRYGCPVVLVGDMNTDYSSKAVQNAMKYGFRHAHDVATDYAEEQVGYHSCYAWGYEEKYSDAPFESAIDHIFVLDFPTDAVKRFARHSPDYYFPISDHSAAYVDLDLTL